MLIFRLWNYIRGYVIIFVEGYFLEKFVNICTRRQFCCGISKGTETAKWRSKSASGA